MANILKNKKILAVAGAIFVAALTFLALMFVNRARKMNELEQIAVSDFGSKFMLYAEELDIDESQESANTEFEKYVAFALTYAINEDGKDRLSKKELSDYILKFFDIELSDEQFDELTLSPYLNRREISFYDEGEGLSFYIDRYNTNKYIVANTPFVGYQEVESKMKGNEVTVVYDKYVIDNPHSLVGSFSNLEDIDVPGIKKYLDGQGVISPLKKAATKVNLRDICEPVGQLTVTYVVKDGKILIRPF